MYIVMYNTRLYFSGLSVYIVMYSSTTVLVILQTLLVSLLTNVDNELFIIVS